MCVCVCVCLYGECRLESEPGFPAECLLSHSVCVCVLLLLSSLLPEAQNGQIHSDWNQKAAAAAAASPPAPSRSHQPVSDRTGGTTDPTSTTTHSAPAPVPSHPIF